MKASIFCFTDKGYQLASEIKHHFEVNAEYIQDVEILNDKDKVEQSFVDKDIIIFICACGIAVRLIAPYVKDKLTDPAVLVIEEKGSFVIPILSGHVGGANDAARYFENNFGMQAVITTATDVNNIFSVDEFAKSNGLSIKNRSNIKKVSAGLLKGQATNVVLSDDVLITSDENEVDDEVLGLIYKPVVIGVGCRKNKDSFEFENFVLNTLFENDLSISDIFAIASIDIKKDEPAIVDFCEKYNLEYYTFSSKELEMVQGQFEESEFVKNTVGVSDVSARAAKALGKNGHFILDKKKADGMTISIFEKYRRITFKYEKA